ncbi:MAG: ATPase, T2SS/T4P/T4SS family, partial [Gemmiger sp.]
MKRNSLPCCAQAATLKNKEHWQAPRETAAPALLFSSNCNSAHIKFWCEVMNKMDEYYAAIHALPESFYKELAALPPEVAPHVQEVRIRTGAPVGFSIRGALVPCVKYLPQAKVCAKVGRNDIKECFLTLCRYSVYAYEEELKEGYLTVDGGNRVGVAGIRGPYGFSTVTSLNLRISRWITCSLPPGVLQALRKANAGILVAGAPGSGKTTVLRSMIEYMGRTGRNFCVVDERSEIFGHCIPGIGCE